MQVLCGRTLAVRSYELSSIFIRPQWKYRACRGSSSLMRSLAISSHRYLSAQPDKKPDKKSEKKEKDKEFEEFMDQTFKKLGDFIKDKMENEKGGDKNKKQSNNEKKGGDENSSWSTALFALSAVVALYLMARSANSKGEMTWTEFTMALKQGRIAKIDIINRSYAVVYMDSDSEFSSGTRQWINIGSPDMFEMRVSQTAKDLGLDQMHTPPIQYKTDILSSIFKTLLEFGFSIGSLLLAFYLLNRFMTGRIGKSGGGMGGMGSIFNPAGQGHSKVVTENTGVKFADVAGCEEAKIEIMEFVNFLKNPQQYTALGAKIPKGAMLTGPPGTGKTLLAKATAGEAGVPFISANGSEFLEVFVGVGPQRVRELFKTAREKAPVILFIDEIDAIGRKRSGGMMGGNSERENTLNQLLVEMDGFNTSADLPVIVFAATNRGDVLDQALLRPGRFDRKIEVGLPDIKGRASICKVHLKPLTMELDKAEFAKKLSALLPGFSGADIANVCNESALIAAREGSNHINEKHFDSAIGRVVGGLEKRSRVLQEHERKTVAYHEAGHVIAGWFFEHAEPTLKVSIVPRGRALGYAQLTPKELYLYSTEQIFHRMCQLFGGRVAEEVFFGRITSGAQDDLQKITNMAYSQVVMWGMDEQVGPVSFDMRQTQENFGQKPYSDETARLIDERVRKIVREAHSATTEMLQQHKEKLAALAEKLMLKEILSKEEIADIIGPRPYDTKNTYDELVEGTGGTEENTELPEGLKNWNKSSEESSSNSETTSEENSNQKKDV